ncbi:MAG: hypothetical protein CMN73_09610 [Sphingomonas sp.]|nr:hypothetical protein [Sphingomonas sp.]|tara:strand:- start:1197 stop:1652 length:456 start_codon:yes stop_codon:yes gene_type:complete
MHPKRENLIADASLAAIEQALPGAKEVFLNDIRPEGGADEKLWLFNDLSNLDKHNLIIPALTFLEVGVIRFNSGGGSISLTVHSDASKPQTLIRLPEEVPIQNNFKAAVEIKFAEGDHPFEDEPVIPTLTQIAGIVTHTINKFEGLINQRA